MSKVTLSAACTLSCWEVPDNGAALEAAAAAGKVVVTAAAVPVTWADVQGGQNTTRAIAVTELQVRVWVTATLTVITAAEVEVLAVLAVPVSRLPLDVHSQSTASPAHHACVNKSWSVVQNITKQMYTKPKGNYTFLHISV